MEIIDIPKPEVSAYEKVSVATEAAFNSLVAKATALGLPVDPVNGLMYLPDQALTRQFQEACRAVLKALGAEF